MRVRVICILPLRPIYRILYKGVTLIYYLEQYWRDETLCQIIITRWSFLLVMCKFLLSTVCRSLPIGLCTRRTSHCLHQPQGLLQDLKSISLTLYKQLFCLQIQKAQKDSQVILRFWDQHAQELLKKHRWNWAHKSILSKNFKSKVRKSYLSRKKLFNCKSSFLEQLLSKMVLKI